MKKIDNGKTKQIGHLKNIPESDNPRRGRIYSSDNLCPTLFTERYGGVITMLSKKSQKNNHKTLIVPCHLSKSEGDRFGDFKREKRYRNNHKTA